MTPAFRIRNPADPAPADPVPDVGLWGEFNYAEETAPVDVGFKSPWFGPTAAQVLQPGRRLPTIDYGTGQRYYIHNGRPVEV